MLNMYEKLSWNELRNAFRNDLQNELQKRLEQSASLQSSSACGGQLEHQSSCFSGGARAAPCGESCERVTARVLSQLDRNLFATLPHFS